MSLMDFLGGGNNNTILMQAVGAAMRGESPQDFMRRLANEHPQLRELDLNNLQGTAQQLAQQKGVNVDSLTRKLDGMIDPMIKK